MEISERDKLIKEINERHFASTHKWVGLMFFAFIPALIITIIAYFVGDHGLFPEDARGNPISYDEKVAVYKFLIIPFVMMTVSGLVIGHKKDKKNRRIRFLMGEK